jgi:hypothetical protein
MVNISAGDYLPGALLTTEIKANNDSTLKIGDVCTVQSNVWTTAGTSGASAKGPFRVAVSGSGYTTAGASTIQTTDTSFSALVEGYVYVTADGTIQPGALVTPNGATTAGRVVAYVATTIPTTPLQADVQNARDEFRLACGVYEGHAGEGSVNAVPTAAAQGDVIRIRFRGQV